MSLSGGGQHNLSKESGSASYNITKSFSQFNLSNIEIKQVVATAAAATTVGTARIDENTARDMISKG